jgi:hypothetical protein
METVMEMEMEMEMENLIEKLEHGPLHLYSPTFASA